MKLTKQQKRSRLLERQRIRVLRQISTLTGDYGSLNGLSDSLDRKRGKTLSRVEKTIKAFNKEAKFLHEVRRMNYKHLEDRAISRYKRKEEKAVRAVLSVNKELEKGVKKDYKNQVRHFAKIGKTTQKEVMKNFKITAGTILTRINNRFFYLENAELFRAASIERQKLNKKRRSKGQMEIRGRLGVGSFESYTESDINTAYDEFRRKLKG